MAQIVVHKLKLLYGVLIVILFVPWIQNTLNLVTVKELNGDIKTKYNPVLDERSWIEGRFQFYKEAYLNDAFGFRPSFIRLHNQIDFYLFDKVHANSVIRGKENYLFEKNYIKAYYGQDFIGEDSIRTRMIKLKKIQDSLTSKNKTLILVFASSKGQFYPEYFPDSSRQERTTTNYERHLQYAKEFGIHYIDFNDYFIKQKSSSPYPLYPKYGIHWSYYGACLVADSILHYIEKARNLDLPELEWSSIEADQARFADNDIEKGLNLIFSLKGPNYAYPKVFFERSEDKTNPRIMVIADSYYWTLFKLDTSGIFYKNPFWYYYKEVFERNIYHPQMANQVLLKKALRSQDVFIIMSTDANLTNLGWGFIEWTSRLVDHDEYLNLDYEERLENLIKYIPTDSVWIQAIRKKAIERGISVDSMVILDATWLLENESKK